MKKLTKTDIMYVAKLSNLDLTEKEIEKFTPQLSKVIDFISELSEVDTKGVEPTAQTTKLSNVFRPDNVKPKAMLTQEQALSGSKEKYKALFKVSAILSDRTDK